MSDQFKLTGESRYKTYRAAILLLGIAALVVLCAPAKAQAPRNLFIPDHTRGFPACILITRTGRPTRM
jgi:hypothetical protein